jgi:hypothetical protein
MKNLPVILIRNIRRLALTVIALSAIIFNVMTYAEKTPKPIVDLFKTNQTNIKIIQKKFGDNFQRMAEIMQSPDSVTTEKNSQNMSELLSKTIDGINELGNFSLVTVSPIVYPAGHVTYFTVDVVDKSDKKRLSYFSTKPTGNLPDPDHLIKSWQEYEKIAFVKFLKSNTAPIIKSCPAFHCVFGYDYPELEKYRNIFVNQVPKNKAALIAVLKQDKDENKRAAAAYLLAHIHDANELVKILIPSMRDPSNGVRNSAMRVLGATLANNNVDFPVDEAITALDYPMETDRNKALYIILSLTNQPRYAKYIALHAKTELIEELKMRQLNLHSLAYESLKKISGKNYNEHNYKAWEKWLDKNSETTTS